MTRNKGFKQKVRARMARTGERYAAARANLTGARAAAPAWQTLAGVHPETTAVARLAAAAGVRASEALVLGLGGGIGGLYMVFDYKGLPPTFYIATRCFPQYAYGAGFVTTAARRLGLALDVVETGSKPAAARQLAERVAGGPAIAWLDRTALPWGARPAGVMGAMPHVVVVGAIDGDAAVVHDTGAAPERLALADLAAARARLAKEKHRLAAVSGTASVDLAASVREAIASCVDELAGKHGPKQLAGNCGINALRKWASLVDAPKEKRGWPRLFREPAALAGALTWGHHWIEDAGTGGGGFRPMYAAFLDEAAAITGRRALGDAAAAYRALGARWTELAGVMRSAAADPSDPPAIRAEIAARLRRIVEDETEAMRLITA